MLNEMSSVLKWINPGQKKGYHGMQRLFLDSCWKTDGQMDQNREECKYLYLYVDADKAKLTTEK